MSTDGIHLSVEYIKANAISGPFYPNNLKSIPTCSGIYVLVSNIDEKLYVGRSLNLKHRLYKHFRGDIAKYSGQKLYHAKTKHGVDNFTIYIMEFCDPSIIVEREYDYMKRLHPFDERGYNIRSKKDDSDGSYIMDDLQKEKISKSLKLYHETNDNAFLGKTHTPEGIEAIKKGVRNIDGTLKADFFSDEYREKRRLQSKHDKAHERLHEWLRKNPHPREKQVAMIDPITLKTLKTFDSIKKAEQFTGKRVFLMGKKGVSNALNGRTATSSGFIWSYL